MWNATPFIHNRKEKTHADVFLYAPADFHIPLADASTGLLLATFELPADDPRWARLTRLIAETLFLKYYENPSLDRELAFEQALQEVNRRLPDLYLNFGRSWLSELTASIVLLTDDSCFFYHVGAPVSAWWLNERRLTNLARQLAKPEEAPLHPLKVFSQYHRAPAESLMAFCLAGPLLSDLLSGDRLQEILSGAAGSHQAVEKLQTFLHEVPPHIPLYGFMVMRETANVYHSSTTHYPVPSNKFTPPAPSTSESWFRRYRRLSLKLQRFSLRQKGLLMGSALTLLILLSTVGTLIGHRWLATRRTTLQNETASVLTEINAAKSALLANSQGLAITHAEQASQLFAVLPPNAKLPELAAQLSSLQTIVFHFMTTKPDLVGRANPSPPLLFDLTTLIPWNKSPWPHLDPPLQKPLATSAATAPNTAAVLDAETNRLLLINKKTSDILSVWHWEQPVNVQNAVFDEGNKTVFLLSGTNVYKFLTK